MQSQCSQHSGLLDSKEDEPAEDILEQPIEVEKPDCAPEEDQAVPVPPPVAAAPRSLPDMCMVKQRGGGAGSLLLNLNLKRNASEMSLSLSETFEYLTSTRAPIEEAAAILQTFGNVGLVSRFSSCLWTCRMVFAYLATTTCSLYFCIYMHILS